MGDRSFSHAKKLSIISLLIFLLITGFIFAVQAISLNDHPRWRYFDDFDDYVAGVYDGELGPGGWAQIIGGGGNAIYEVVSDVKMGTSGKSYKLDALNVADPKGKYVKSVLYKIYYYPEYLGPNDYSVYVWVRITNPLGGEGGIIFRINSPKNRYYLATVWKKAKELHLQYVDETTDTREDLVSPVDISGKINVDDWFRISVDVHGSWINVALEQGGAYHPLINVKDDRLQKGGVGLFTSEYKYAYFDDFLWTGEITAETVTVTSTTTKTSTSTLTTTKTATITQATTITGGATTLTQTTTETTTLTVGATATQTITETTTLTTGVTTETTTVTVTSATFNPTVTTATAAGEFDFSLTATPTTLSLKPGDSASIAILVDLLSGETQNVTLTAAGLPSDFTYVLTPPTVTPSGASTLQLTAGKTPGTYTLIIQAQGGGKTKSVIINLKVEPESRCLIATAAFGSELAPQVQTLREFRDGFVLTTFAGRQFMNLFNAFYYSWSPYVASAERNNPLLRDAVKTLIYPLIYSLEVSRQAAAPFSEIPELAVLISGIIISTLIGLIYVSPILTITLLLRQRKNKEIRIKLIQVALALLVSLAFFTIAELTSLPQILALATVTIVLTSITLGALAPMTIIETLKRYRSK